MLVYFLFSIEEGIGSVAPAYADATEPIPRTPFSRENILPREGSAGTSQVIYRSRVMYKYEDPSEERLASVLGAVLILVS